MIDSIFLGIIIFKQSESSVIVTSRVEIKKPYIYTNVRLNRGVGRTRTAVQTSNEMAFYMFSFLLVFV